MISDLDYYEKKFYCYFELTKLDNLLKGTEAWKVYRQLMDGSHQDSNNYKFLDNQYFSKIDEKPKTINVKIDEPEEAAIQLLKHYQGKDLEKLIDLLKQNL
ncbi:MAG: hypothetical protein F6K18_21625 [Okeania sp. SIO2C2]|uniref:hypothetical protein n=1 Tax=Okeania sp. SIO2C2 TaxID=2607787 RepID=UPI0013B953C4|nr:hypothetical protein [Okeania sp. SIO2C2]NEP89218.1 hypothetical protein [Okeania sp. SIO2C2]